MDVPRKIIVGNFYAMVVFAAYFHFQLHEGALRAISFVAAVPVVKLAIVRLVVPVEVETADKYPLKPLAHNLARRFFGVWTVLVLEMIRRTVDVGFLGGGLPIAMMAIPLTGFIFAESTGICYTNTRRLERGSMSFRVSSWFEIMSALLFGSGWFYMNGA